MCRLVILGLRKSALQKGGHTNAGILEPLEVSTGKYASSLTLNTGPFFKVFKSVINYRLQFHIS